MNPKDVQSVPESLAHVSDHSKKILKHTPQQETIESNRLEKQNEIYPTQQRVGLD